MQTDISTSLGPVLHQNMKRSVLVVDDEEINREILGAILEEHYDVIYAKDGIEAMELAKKHSYTLSAVLLDLVMPRMSGLTVIKQMKADPVLRRLPIIVLTSETYAEVQSLDLGASDFIPKPYDAPAVILARVRRTIELSEDQTVLQDIERDSLTRLLTKEFFYEYIHVTRHFYIDKDMDAIVLNIDHFHLINEIYGRDTGDDILLSLSETIYLFVREHEGTAARGEADTFLLYLNRQDNYDELLIQIEKSFQNLSDSVHAHVRMGIYPQKPSDEDSIESIFDRARMACNSIRGNLQQSIAYYDQGLQRTAIFEERLIHDTYDAIEKNQFIVYFQPKYNIQGDEPVLCGAEALIRWEHPDFGMVSPGAFISLFEKNGLIQKVDHFVWREVAGYIRKWKDAYGFPFPISVNMSRIDIYDENMEQRILSLLEEFQLQPQDFHIEITESAYSDNADDLIHVINRLREKDFVIEMDDFGAGYSSLNMLTLMPIDVLKMDMQFVRDMHKDEKRLKMIELVMDIAGFLSVPVVAEGVEEENQYTFLKDVGCQMIQGYYLSKPLPPAEFEKLIQTINEK